MCPSPTPGRVEIIDRRGDVLWSVTESLDDPRWAVMTDLDTVLIACKKELQIHHRTRGLLRTIGGFRSVGSVRYHPQRPWIIHDAGSTLVLFDPTSGARFTRPVGWTNAEEPAYSKYLDTNEPWPE